MTANVNPWLITCVGVATDLPLLPHFIRHYRTLGIDPDRMVVILNALSNDHPDLARATEILAAHSVRSPEIWISPYTSETMWAQRREVQKKLCGSSQDWVLSADVDEYHDYPEPLEDMLNRAETLEANCIQGVFIDRLASGGTLSPVAETPELLDQFPVKAEVALSIGGRSASHGRGGTVKIMAARGQILPGRGGHRPMPNPDLSYLYRYALGDFPQIEDPRFRFSVPTRVHHIHWTDTLPQRLETRLATPGVSPAGAEYGQRQLDHIYKHGGIDLGSVALDDEDRSIEWPTELSRLRKLGRRHSIIGSVRALARKAIGR